MKNIITALLLFCTCQFTFAQVETNANGTPKNEKLGFFLGYYGYQFGNLGLQLGIENYLATTRNFKIIWSSYLQFHHRDERQTAVALITRIGQRYTMNFGLTLETHLGIGFQYTNYIQPVYHLGTATPNRTTTNTGKVAAAPNLALGIGYDFSKTTKLPITYYLRAGLAWTFPDLNLVFNTAGFFETGIIYRPKLNKK